MQTLRGAAESLGLHIGAAVNINALESDAAYRDLLAREFNLVMAENGMKWRELRPSRYTYDFHYGDRLVEFAEAHRMQVFGQMLCWHQAIPPWAQVSQYNRSEWMKILRDHIYTVVGHYRGQIQTWNVINEIFNLQGGYEDTFWRERIGEEYIAHAFQWAHEADPEAVLIYNEWDADGHKDTRHYVFEMVGKLKTQGVPIHGVGMQMHIALDDNDWVGAPPSPDQIATQMTRLADLGLSTHITEMDIQLGYSKGSEQENLQRQAELYGDITQAALATPNFRTLIIYGVTDKHSWIPAVTGKPDAPLLFDRSYQPKPAYESVLKSLQGI